MSKKVVPPAPSTGRFTVTPPVTEAPNTGVSGSGHGPKHLTVYHIQSLVVKRIINK